MSEPDIIAVAKVGAPFGVRGWVKVRTQLEDSALLFGRSHWQVRAPSAVRRARKHAEPWASREVLGVKRHADAIVAQLAGATDRDAAVSLRHYEIGLPRDLLGEAGPDAFFWVDLVGLPVVTTDGVGLGTVAQMMETGANDVLVVRGRQPVRVEGDGEAEQRAPARTEKVERLIPFLMGDVVREVVLRSTVDPANGDAGGERDEHGEGRIVVDWDPDF